MYEYMEINAGNGIDKVNELATNGGWRCIGTRTTPVLRETYYILERLKPAEPSAA